MKNKLKSLWTDESAICFISKVYVENNLLVPIWSMH